VKIHRIAFLVMKRLCFKWKYVSKIAKWRIPLWNHLFSKLSIVSERER